MADLVGLHAVGLIDEGMVCRGLSEGHLVGGVVRSAMYYIFSAHAPVSVKKEDVSSVGTN